MNITVFLKKNKLTVPLFFLALCSSCQSLSPFFYTRPFEPSTKQEYDAVIKSFIGTNNKNVDPLLNLYRFSVGKVAYSECKNAPSDSFFLRVLEQRSSYGSLFFAVARVLKESSLNSNSPHLPFSINEKLVWADFSGFYTRYNYEKINL